MRVKLDENLPVELAEDLSALGHDVETVHGERLSGSPDSRVVEAARREKRVLFTLDKGLGDLRRYPPRLHGGIVLFRLEQRGRGATRRAVVAALGKVTRLRLTGRLVVVTAGSVRTR